MKPTWLLGIGALGLAVLVLTFHTVSGTGPGALFAQNAKLDPRVLEDTAGGRVGRFLVVLKEQADPQKAASQARNRPARRLLAVDALRGAAAHSQPAVRTQLDALAVNYRAYWIANVIAVEGDRAVVDALARRGDVLAIESDRAFRVPLEQPEGPSSRVPSGIEWNIEWVNAPDVWALGYTGQGIIYANADTGVDWDHPALKPQYRGWNGTTADHNYSWWDAIHSDISGDGTNPCGFSSPVPCADQGHGTHTTGIGVGDDGSANQVGMAPGAKWIACRNMDQGVGRPSTYIECMQFFLAPTDLDGNNPDPSRGSDVVGNSYTCPPSEGCSADSLQLAIQNLRDAGIFMAVAAGNSGPACSTIDDPPALEDSAITVGASGFQTDSIAGFSSRGPVAVDGSNRRKPDLVAPGVRVRSSYPADTYSSLSGTSMAAPHVAGAAALLWSAYPDLRGNVDLTEFVLGETALHLTTTEGCGGDSPTQVPNNVYGHGRIDVLAAYEYLAANPPPTPSPSATATLSNTPTPTSTPVTPTETATPSLTPTATPTAGVCVPPFTSIVPDDSDCDGAPDAAEDGDNPATCGTRDKDNPWDFYDVPAPTLFSGGSMNDRNRAINVTGDVLAVLEYTATSDGGSCNAGPDGTTGTADDRCYNDDLDGDGVDDGIVYDRSAGATWSGPPDGAISILTDVLLVLAQTGHSC